MKHKLVEAWFSFLALFLFACALAAVVVLGIMMVPLVILALFVLAIREIVLWKRKSNRQVIHQPVGMQRKRAVIVRSMAAQVLHRRAA